MWILGRGPAGGGSGPNVDGCGPPLNLDSVQVVWSSRPVCCGHRGVLLGLNLRDPRRTHTPPIGPCGVHRGTTGPPWGCV